MLLSDANLRSKPFLGVTSMPLSKKPLLFPLVLRGIMVLAICSKLFASQPTTGNDYLFEMSLEQLIELPYDVSTASKYQQEISDAPASVTVITADEIRKYGYHTLPDILNSVPGFYINYDRNYHYLGIRGFRRPGDYNTRVLVLIDGHRTNENVGDASYIGTQFPVDVDLIDRVEIIRGPGFSLYGNNALLAVVNVITKGANKLQGLELSGQLASFNSRRGRATYGKVFGEDAQLLVSATGYESEGQQLYFKEFDSPSTFNGLVKNDGDKFGNFFAKASVGNFILTAAHTAENKGIPTAPWDSVFADSRTQTSDDTTLIGLTYNRNLSDWASVKARAVYGSYDYQGTWPTNNAPPGEDPDIVLAQDSWSGRWCDTELQLFAQPLENHKLVCGLESRYNIRQNQQSWDEMEVYLDDHRSSQSWGLYLQDEFAVSDKLTFVAGIRHDRYDTFGGTTNSRLAAIYHPMNNTTLKLLYGEAFRAPSAYELYYNDGDYTQKASLNLRPETIKNYEIILERELNKKMRATVSGFHYIMHDLIDQYIDPADGLLVFKNLNEVKATGIETGLEGMWGSGLKTRVSYSYVEAEDDATGQQLVNSPNHLAKLNLTTPILEDRLFAGLGLLYSSKARTLSGNYTDNFTIVNLVLTYENVIKGLEISAGLYNLFDTKYGFPGAGEHVQDIIYQDGRTLMIKFIYRFK